MTRLLAGAALGAALALAAAPPAHATAQEFGGHIFQGSVPEYAATISGARIFVTGPSGFGIEAMFEMPDGLLANLTSSETEDYAAFNAQLGVVQRFGSGPGQMLTPYVSAGWYPAFERNGDEISSYTPLFYANGGAELALFGGLGLFAEAGVGLGEGFMPIILRFGLGGT